MMMMMMIIILLISKWIYLFERMLFAYICCVFICWSQHASWQEHVRNKQRYNKMLKDCLSRVWGCQHGNDESTCANCCSDLRTEGTPIVLAILAKFGRSVSWFILAREDHLQRYISEWDHAGTTYGLLKWKICFTLHLLWSEFCLKDSRVRRKMRLKEEISPSDPIEAWTI